MYLYTRIASVLALLLLLPLAPVAADAGRLVDVRRDARGGIGTTEANITRLIADLLQQSQFTHRPLDFELAGAFLDRYLSVLDSDRLLFLQSDVDEFSIHRATLANDTRRSGDTRVAHAIFARYLERLEQRVAFVTEALAREDFDFAKEASYRLDRTKAERPRDLADARGLWRQRLMVDYLQEKLDDRAPEEIATTLRRRAERSLQAMQQMSRDAVLEVYLSALAHVYDPHSDYLGHEQLQEFAIGMNLSLFGIGAKLQSEDGFCKLVELVPGGPAERSELLTPGDRIVAVAQGDEEPVDVIELPLTRIVQLIRGPKGSVVKLTVIPAGAGDDALRKTIRLVRDEIKLEERRAKARIIDLPQAPGSTLRLGVIDLPSFYSSFADGSRGGSRQPASGISATDDVARLLERFATERVQGVILDLRRNGGGVLEEAIRLTGLFIRQGPVVQTRGPRGDVEVGVDDDPALAYGGPLIVLTSRFSASASEIVAGALQDYDRALIVGDPSTFGKGTVQSVVRLAPIMNRMGLRASYDPGALTLTIRKFYRPSGVSTQLEGVVPDIVLPSANSPEIGESTLDNPLPWDTVSPTDYPRLQMVRGYLPTLRAESARRVATAQDFAYLNGEMERIARQRANRTVSLNESVRRRELAEIERRRDELELALSSAGEIAAVRYELSINDLARPGLPPPMPRVAERLGAARATGEGSADQADGPAPRDVVLLEAKRILADYVMLLDDGAASRTRPVAARAPRETAVQ